MNRIFFPEIQHFLIPSFLRSSNKEMKGQIPSKTTFLQAPLKNSKPTQVLQSLEIERSHKTNPTNLVSFGSAKEKDPFHPECIGKWFRSMDPKNPESNKPLWNYLFPEYPWSTEQFLFMDENQKFQTMVHITGTEVYMSLIFSSDFWGEMGFVLRADQLSEENLSIFANFSNQISEEIFLGEFRRQRETKDWELETKVSELSSPNGNYR